MNYNALTYWKLKGIVGNVVMNVGNVVLDIWDRRESEGGFKCPGPGESQNKAPGSQKEP